MAHMENRRVGRVEQVWKRRRNDEVGYATTGKKKSLKGEKRPGNQYRLLIQSLKDSFDFSDYEEE